METDWIQDKLDLWTAGDALHLNNMEKGEVVEMMFNELVKACKELERLNGIINNGK